MAEPVIMNIKNDAFTYSESRNQPFIVWLQFMNFAMVSAICWLSLKIYRGFLSLYEWMFPLNSNKFYNPLVLVAIRGTENDLNKEIMRQLSCLFRSKIIQLKDFNDNLSAIQESNKESLIICAQIQGSSKEEITKLSSYVRRTFGDIDLLIISQNVEPSGCGGSPHGFLNNLNKQLLAQFWTVMAFLPGMLQRNHGHIVSIAQGRTSSLTNTGIVRSVCEELLLSDTNVRLKLVERNSFVDEYLPALPSDILARLIIRSIWTSNSFVQVPSISQYILMIFVVFARSVLQPILKILSIITTCRPK